MGSALQAFGGIPLPHLVVFGVIELLTLVILAIVILRSRSGKDLTKWGLTKLGIGQDVVKKSKDIMDVAQRMTAHERQCEQREAHASELRKDTNEKLSNLFERMGSMERGIARIEGYIAAAKKHG